MKTPTLLLMLFVCGHFSVAQITFEKGYFIDTLNQRTECEIKNRDWRNNPSEFEYRISGTVRTMTVSQLQEFGVYDKSKYTVATVQIDKSPVAFNALSRKRNAEFETRRLALKVLVEGRARLFMYENQNVVRFFYSIEGDEIRQLVYKMYHSSTGKVLKNNEYRQDLLTKLNCGNISQKDIEKVQYKRNDLEKYFISYTRCSGQEQTSIRREESRQPDMIIRPNIGGGVTTMKYKYSDAYDALVMKNGSTYRIGAELEMVLPFNNNKWSIIADLFYQKSENNGTFEDTGNVKFAAKHSSVNLATGGRYHFFLPGGKINKIFVEAMIQVIKPTKIDMSYYTSTSTLDGYTPGLFVQTALAAGAGVSLNRLNVEVRCSFADKINNNASPGEISFTRTAIILSYRIN